MKKKNVILYIVVTYIAFLVSILLAGGIMLLSKNGLIAEVVVIPCSWTPTMVLFILFHKLVQKKSRKEFIKGLFREVLNARFLCVIMAVQVIAFIISINCA